MLFLHSPSIEGECKRGVNVFRVEPEELRAVIASQIRGKAKAKKLSVVALAKAARVTQSHTYAVLAGEKSPTADWLAKIAKALDCQPYELLRPPRDRRKSR
ncbi:MAG: helix-turn-helix transcriptional regulator [Deltaproteobacteria bacterium]|nr:helix-turn-helix transcriptional regulator [Deltaproteobacteria bacterium]